MAHVKTELLKRLRKATDWLVSWKAMQRPQDMPHKVWISP